MTESPIFIVGSPRSGTTLLRDLLRSHPRLSFPSESSLLPQLYALHGDPRSDREARLLAEDFLGTYDIQRWNLELRPADVEHARSFAAVVTPAYEEWARREGKPRWGDKTPQNVIAIPLLARLFPTAQFVHVIRDGRDVALSMAARDWGKQSAYTAAVYWRACVEGGLADGPPLGPGRYHEVVYEELLTSPEQTLRGLCAYLGEEFDPALERPSRIPDSPGQPPQWQPRFQDRLDASSVGRWRTEMAPDEEVVFESVAGDLLRRRGYETRGATRAIGAVERLRWKARDGVSLLRWRATAWDRSPRLRTNVRHTRSRVLKTLGRTGAS